MELISKRVACDNQISYSLQLITPPIRNSLILYLDQWIGLINSINKNSRILKVLIINIKVFKDFIRNPTAKLIRFKEDLKKELHPVVGRMLKLEQHGRNSTRNMKEREIRFKPKHQNLSQRTSKIITMREMRLFLEMNIYKNGYSISRIWLMI